MQVLEIIALLHSSYKYIDYDLADHRSSWCPLVSSPWPVTAIIISYYYFCTDLGPKIMKTRDAFDLKKLMVVYNTFQVIACATLFYQAFTHLWPGKYSFFCQPVNYSTDPDALWELTLAISYFFLKIVDCFDTILFVLRKKQSHVTFLHLYHHMGMVFGSYIAAKYLPGGHLAVLGVINTFVHTIMYTYYLLAVLDFRNETLLWCKKYITQLQMIQFLVLALQSFPTLFWQHCDYPKWPRALMTVQYLFMFCLFANFYNKAYRNKKKDYSHCETRGK